MYLILEYEVFKLKDACPWNELKQVSIPSSLFTDNVYILKNNKVEDNSSF